MKVKPVHITILLLQMQVICYCQDPHFSQFFMAPQFINPSLIGKSEGDWRIMGNFRHQWGNAGTPFTTAVFAGDMKLRGGEANENTLAAGIAGMYDQSMKGAFKSSYLVGNIAYHARLNSENTIGIGFHGMYGNRRIDYSKLTFGEQFSSNGFDVTLPSGETPAASLKPFFSIGTGFLYNHKSALLNLGIGASMFHLNKPNQSFLGDAKEVVPKRFVAHANAEFNASSTMTINLNAIYQQQAKPSYFAIGGAIGMDLSSGDKYSVFYVGGWFREGDSFYPYVGFTIGKVQLGFTYDITHSKQNQGPSIPQSFEMSFVIRDVKDNPETAHVRCPWN